MTKLRIAFFLDVMEEDFDGVSKTMHQIIQRIPTEEFEPIFITPQPPLKDIGFPVYLCPSIKFPIGNKSYRLATPMRMRELKPLLDKFEPDLLHFSSPSGLGIYAVKYGKKRNIPVTTIYHTHFPSFANYYFRFIPKVEAITDVAAYRFFWMYRKVSKLFAPTESMRQYLLGKDVPEEVLKIWGRGVNIDDFGMQHRVKGLWTDIPESNKIVLFVSRLVKEKEPKTLIRLYRLLAERRTDISMVIVGDGPARQELQQNMPNAIFTGKLVGEDLSRAYASSDVFVFPSTTETFGNVILEAMASGLPVVAADKGGPSDILRTGETGFLVKPQMEEEFYDRIVQLADQPALYDEIREAAVSYAKSQTWESLCEDLFREYRALVK